MKLITETTYSVELYEESKNGKDNLYLVGVYSTADTKNINERRYKKDLLDREIKKVYESKINNSSCYGELNHPASPDVNPERAAILIENLEWKDKNVFGKSKVLRTPMGNIVRNIMEDGGRLGVSSRGLGTVGDGGWVNEDFNLITYDIVSNPSNVGSWVNGIYEGTEFNSNYVEEASEMTKKHFEKIASVISSLRDIPGMNNKIIQEIANRFADELSSYNLSFNRDRFMKAAIKRTKVSEDELAKNLLKALDEVIHKMS
jgi:hypothetical protein